MKKKLGKVLLGIVGLIFLSIITINLTSAASCPSGWTFIDKQMYNVCYLPNVTQVGQMNITDNNNNTRFSYLRDSFTYNHGVITQNYLNYSDLMNDGNVDFLYFKSGNVSNDQRGFIYFMEDYIVISGEKKIRQNYTAQDRFTFTNYGVNEYINMISGANFTNPAGGADNILISGTGTIKHIFNDGVNATITGRGQLILLNKSYETFYPNTNYNISMSKGNTTGTSISSRTSQVQVRTVNQTELGYSMGIIINLENNTAYNYIGMTWLMSFNDSHFVAGTLISNASHSGFSGLYGLTLDWSTNCAANTPSGVPHSCSPWNIKDSISALYRINKNTKQLPYSLQDVVIAHGNNLYKRNGTIETFYAADYPHQIPTGIVSNNAFNNTHTRFIADYLDVLSETYKGTSIENNTINELINHLQNIERRTVDGNKPLIPHSTGTARFYDNQTVINTQSITISALLNIYKRGFIIDATKVNNYINTLLTAQPLFNETLGNTSFYSTTAINVYYPNSSYGSISYASEEIHNFRQIYNYQKNESSREIANRKINELNTAWNGINYTSVVSSRSYNGGTSNAIKARAEYQRGNISAFTYSGGLDASTELTFPPLSGNLYGQRYVTEDLPIVTIYYPVHLVKNNRSYYVDDLNGLIYESPEYAMLLDYKYDESGRGMSTWIKWAYNSTNGNFTNITQSPYKYWYSPQHGALFNYSQRLNFTATTSASQYWTGNVSDSVKIRVQEGGNTNFIVDDISLGTLSLSNVSGSYTNKTIINNFPEPINHEAIVTVDTCDVSRVKLDGENMPFTCSGTTLTVQLNNLQTGESQFYIYSLQNSFNYFNTTIALIVDLLPIVAIILIYLIMRMIWTRKMDAKVGIGLMIGTLIVLYAFDLLFEGIITAAGG